MVYDDRLLLYFQTIVNERNISRAADKLYITQSSLSKYLKGIEDEVGATLIDRKTVPLKLTLAGEKFLAYLNESAQLYNHSMLEIARISSDLPRELIIGTSSMNSRMVSDAFPAFYNRFPNVQLTMLEDHSENLLRMLENERLDIAILVRSGNDISDTDFPYELLISQQRLIVVSKKNELAALAGEDNSPLNPTPFDIRNLKGQKLIAGKMGQRVYGDMHEMVKKRRIPIQGFVETQSVETMISLAQNNYGVCVMPEFYLRRFQPLNDFVYFSADYPEFQWALTLEYKSPSPGIPERYFTTILKRVCGKH